MQKKLDENNLTWLNERLNKATSKSKLSFLYERLGDFQKAQEISQYDSYNVDNKLNSHLENLYISQLNELFYIVIDQIAVTIILVKLIVVYIF